MLNFIIQVDKENGIPINDFTYQAYDAIKFMNWACSHELEPIYAHCQFACLEQLQKWEGAVYEHHVPIGTIEFVHTYMEKLGKEIPKPINVPESLFTFAGRGIVNGSIKEFRLFVFNKEIRGISVHLVDNSNLFNPYDGLDECFCKRVVEAYTDSPIAYVLDIGVRENGENIVIECHNFYSCGIYGWSNYAAYINMITEWWKQYISEAPRG